MFSVVIPLYDKEKYILRAVESVLSQSYEYFELIVINDGSLDNSLSVIEKISDSRLKLINQVHQGVGAARNNGISAAKFDWIALLDADDAWSSNHLNELNKIISKFPLSGMVSTRHIQMHTNIALPIANTSDPSHIRMVDYFHESSNSTEIIHSSSVAINKKVFDEIGGFSNKKIGEDLEYWVKVALHYPVAISNRLTAYYFRGTGGVMESVQNDSEVPESLDNISPAVSVLYKESLKDSNLLNKKSIRSYINSRVLTEVKVAASDRDLFLAKSYARLALPQLSLINIYIVLFLIIPSSALEKFIGLYFFIKSKK